MPLIAIAQQVNGVGVTAEHGPVGGTGEVGIEAEPEEFVV